MGRYLLIAARNLAQNRRRTLLLGGAIAIVTVLLVLMTGVSNGIRRTITHAATTLASGHVNVDGYLKPTRTRADLVIEDLARVRRLVRQQVPGARLVVDRTVGTFKVVSAADSRLFVALGVAIEDEPELRRLLQLRAGDLRGLQRPDTIALFESQARRLQVQVGDVVTMSGRTLRGTPNAVDLQVAAIAADIGRVSSMYVLTSREVPRRLKLVGERTSSRIQLYLDAPDRVDAVARDLRRALRAAGFTPLPAASEPWWRVVDRAEQEGWRGQRLGVSTWREEITGLSWIVTTFQGITWAVATVLLIVVVIGVMNTLWIVIRERRAEVGALRAIGMSRAGVLAMFLVETLLLSVGATAAGALLGGLASWGLNLARIGVSPGVSQFLMSDTLVLVVSRGSITAALIVIPTVTTLFSLYPSYRASRLPPAIAMRDAG